MSKKTKLFLVYLRPEAIEIFKTNKYVSGELIQTNSIGCTAVTESPYFLKVTTLSEREIELHIPYQYVLYIMATPDSKVTKDLGFRNNS